MRSQSLRAEVESNREITELDLVVPFTTPELTRSALSAAEQLGAGLRAAIRLIKVQVVPFPMSQSPVHLAFLREQVAAFHSSLPLRGQIVLAREYEPELMRALRPESIVVLASKKRVWRTRTESLAIKLRKAGHRVVLVHTNMSHSGQKGNQCPM